MRHFFLLLLWFCQLAVAASTDRGLDTNAPGPRMTLEEKRVALVIGNASYRTWSPLENPVNDARAMSDTLRRYGFEVITAENATREAMRDALRRFGNALADGGVGLFYYAGHGTQAYGENFLIPTDADIVDEVDIRSAGISLQDVFARMDRADNHLNVVILDACRVFPIRRSTRSGGNEGLTRVTAPSGTLIAYATAPNQVAKDGDGKNSPYTKNLVATINEHPGLKLEDLLKAVRAKVRSETGGKQEPWIESSVEGDFFFDPARRNTGTVVINVPPPVSETRVAERRDNGTSPRKALAELGVSWSNQGFGDALMNGDLDVLELFFAGGWNPLSEYGEGNALAHFLWRANIADAARTERILQYFVKAGISPTAKVVRFRRVPAMDMASAAAQACNAEALEAALNLGGNKEAAVRSLRENYGVSPTDDGVPNCAEQITRIGTLLGQRFQCKPQAWDRTQIGCKLL